jgi:Tfp pilus assembly protein PilX
MMKRTRTKSPAGSRGFAMITALFIMGILLVVAALLLENVKSVASNTRVLEQRNKAYDAAEAGLDSTLDYFDRDPFATSGCPGGSLSGDSFSCNIDKNNFYGSNSETVSDPINPGNTDTVPAGQALIDAKATSLFGKTVYLEAVVSAPTFTDQFPTGAINAGGNVTGGGHMPVYADSTDSVPNDANVKANGNVTSFTTIVQGNTYAVGIDSQVGADGTTHSGSSPITLPNSTYVSNFTSYTYNQAFNNGTVVSPASMTGTKTLSGNVYIGSSSGTSGSGNLDLSNGTFTFNGGIVFVDGYLCLSGNASVTVTGNTIIVVRNQFAQAGNSSSYNVTTGSRGVLAVLGGDSAPSCSAANGNYAFNDSGNGTENLGLVWTPNGSTRLAGNGNLTGAIDAGVNAVLSGGGSGGTFTYNHNLFPPNASAPVNARIVTYGEFNK